MFILILLTIFNMMEKNITNKIQNTRYTLSDVGLRIKELKKTLTSRYGYQRMLRNNIWRLEKREQILLYRLGKRANEKERNELRQIRQEIDQDKYSFIINKGLIKDWEDEMKKLSKYFKALQVIMSLDLKKYKMGTTTIKC